MTPGYVVRPVRAHEWREVRTVRLAALSDEVAAMAFLESYADAATRPDEFWQDRARRSSLDAGEDASARQFVAVADDGTWVGTAVALVERVGDVDIGGAAVTEPVGHVVAVHVAPGHRGQGLLAELFTAATDWLRGQGLPRARLFVHVDNARAQRAYEKCGFRSTGTLITTVAGTEREMERDLSGER
ncbi:Protein N-acetyltransferase, RimJ/RimL family [Blastococcus aggregatus]|uniref:Protein N-acetyltransferase, RimJ/RimL family n=1 Tax=Blastococcus aggregatus TaxID=38502 RepID=A0A285V3Z3_9ACTN|nr:GNAT family N-acetyltransferase [Blastococcus aggregatus]SOC48822.1 Protein N-acetyltransferase, RimJ/RimL family [Blastococcus aggregatus]